VRLVATVPAGSRPELGKRVGVTIKAGDTYLFDAESGEAVLSPA
jgi:hypothetical protein